MLQPQQLLTDPQAAASLLQHRGLPDATERLVRLQALEDRRKALQQQLDTLRAQMNQAAKAIGALMGQGKPEEAEAKKQETATLKAQLAELEAEEQALGPQLRELLLGLPNLPLPDVPTGKGEAENVVLNQNGEPAPAEEPHWDIAKRLGIIDFELGTKITGAGFPVYRGAGARLQRALVAWCLDQAQQAGYLEHQPPLMVNEASGLGTGQLPDKEGQMYHIGADNLYLIPTAEVPLTNLYRDALLEEAELPVRICGYTPCFRREAGSYGKDVRGLNRLHQFDKVEIVQLTTPEAAEEALDGMVRHVQGLLGALGLTYRTLLLCTGDLGFAAAKTLDLEVYSPGQDRWLEVSSVSTFGTYQANRLRLRYRPAKGKPVLCHTLNGSALALPRVVAALLEQYRQADGLVAIPSVLQPYMGGQTHLG